MALSKKVAIGIDLGTTSSAVGVWRNGKVEIIPNDRGRRTTPSYIAFTGDGGRLIGDAAKSLVATNPKNTVWGFKTLLFFDDPAVQEGIPHWPFKVVNVGGKPNVEVVVNGDTKRFTPEELTCLLLLQLKHTAEAYLGQGVTDAVITIPAGFNSFQMAATKKAGELAGLNVLKLVSDPNAAALAYVEKTGTGGVGGGKKNLLVFNVGGGTAGGASVVTVEDGLLEVKATTGSTNMGGEHFLRVSWLLVESKLEVSDIHEVLLVGGSSDIPRIRSHLHDHFHGKVLNNSVDPFEAPVHGAAMLAAIITFGCGGSPLMNLTLRMDMTPFSLGVQTTGDIMIPFIPRNTPMPAKVTRTCTTAYANQSAVIIAVFEGENALAKDNLLLGTFSLSGIPPAPAGAPKIDITFEVDANGTLTVTAAEKSIGKEERLTIDPGNGELLTREELTKKLMNEAKVKKIQDYQKAYASVKSSYEAISKLFCSPQEATDFLAKRMKELELEEKRHESLLTPQEFPIVVGPVHGRVVNRKSSGAGQSGGGPKSKKRRNN